MNTKLDVILILFVLVVLFGCSRAFSFTMMPTGLGLDKAPKEHMEKQIEKLAPVTLSHDISSLPESEQKALLLLVRAAKLMDEAFLRQVDDSNVPIKETLVSSKNPDDRIYSDYFKIMFGPWDRLDEDHPFMGAKSKPAGANFYPSDMDKEEFKNWVNSHPSEKKAFEGTFTMIRRTASVLKAIPYSEYFKDQLVPAAALLKEAAGVTKDASLRTYLLSRAKAFTTDDYYQSDMDWMDLAGDIEVVIGPYEVYEDNLFGYKAAFESFVCVVDHGESEKLKTIAKHLNDMEKNLPVPDKYKNFERGSSSPIKVVNEVFTAGDTKAGIQTTAFNLPNDERVREAKGSKKVMLKNVMNAKFEKCWIPIVNTVLAEKDLKRVSFDGYFNHVLLHEISHGLGPGKIKVDGKETTVNKVLAELYSTIEECKADTLGIYTAQFLIDKGVLPKSLENTLYASYLGGMFRSIRFGIGEAHGGGVAIQLNYYLDKGGFAVDQNGRFYVNDSKIKEAIRALAKDLLVIQAEGDYAAAKNLIETYRVVRPKVQVALDRLKEVPIDIRPVYPMEYALTSEEVQGVINKVKNLPPEPVEKDELAVIETDLGDIVVRFFPDVAPNHCANFKKLAKAGFFDGIYFHRVIPEFVIQGGDIMTRDLNPKNDGTGGPGYNVDAEFNENKHDRGILSMARARDPNSAGSQFFICLSRQRTQALDGKYTVFGEVVTGMEVVDKIVNLPRDRKDRPLEPPVMRRVYMIKK